MTIDTKETRPVVFLDRDGTINVDKGYVGKAEDVLLIEGAAQGIKRLNDEGVLVVIITNQSGIGRGYYTEADLLRVNERIAELLGGVGAVFDHVYYCPHNPDSGCGCRKPAVGMIERAASELGLDPTESYMVGDKAADMGIASGVGAKGVLVKTGYGAETAGKLDELDKKPAYVAEDLAAAVEWIIEDLKGRGRLR